MTTNTEANRDGLQYETPSQGERTPGPWAIGGRAACRIVANADDTVATTMQQSSLSHQWQANAAFIVRACNVHDDLVAALKGLIAVIGKMKPATGEPYGRAIAELIEARAAIAKAEGR